MRATPDGGLRQEISLPSKSLLITLPGSGAGSDGTVQLGAWIEVDGATSLRPGAQVEAWFTFWAVEEAERHVRDGAAFDLWHGRVVGQGRFAGSQDTLS